MTTDADKNAKRKRVQCLLRLLWLVAMSVAIYLLWAAGMFGVAGCESLAYFVTAYAVMEMLGFVAGLILYAIENSIRQNQYDGEFPVPSFYPRNLWEQEIINRTPGGWWLGLFERAIYLGAAFLGKWELVAGYLVLKSASKWKSWTTTSDVLRGSGQLYLADIRAFLARAGLDHRTFLVGTVGNLVAALGGYGCARAIYCLLLMGGNRVSML